jgi:PAS domain S-box-containing protein
MLTQNDGGSFNKDAPQQGSPRGSDEDLITGNRIAIENQVLAAVSRIFSSPEPIEGLYLPFSRELARVMPFDGAGLNTIDFESGSTRQVLSQDIPKREVGSTFLLKGTASEHVAKTQMPLIIQPEDSAQIYRDFPSLKPLGDAGVMSLLMVPIIFKGQSIAVMGLHSYQRQAFTDRHAAFAQKVADQIAGAIANAELQRELQQRVRELEAVLNVAPVGIGIALDPECRYIMANPEFARMLNISPDSNFSVSAPSEERPPFRLYRNGEELPAEELPMQVAAAKGVYVPEQEIDIVWEDGTVVTEIASAAPLLNEDGTPRGCVGIFRDITERKKVNEEASRLAAIVQSSGDAILSKTLDGIITSWNSGAEKQYGYTADEAIGKHLFELIIPPSRQEEFKEILERIKRGQLTEHLETERVTKHGSRIWISLTVSPVLDSRGVIIGASGVEQDITERIRAEQGLRLLAEASTRLSESLDYEITLNQVADLIISLMADWCAIYLVDERGEINRVAVAHQDPDKVRLAREVARRYPTIKDQSAGVPKVLRTGEPELYPQIPDEALVNAAHDEEHLRMLREVGFKSAIVVPLRARGSIIGTLSLVTSESLRQYDEADLAIAQQLADKAALAVDNAWLYQQAEAQRASLKTTLDSIAEGVISVDRHLRVVRANRYALDMLGTAEESLITGRPVAEVLPVVAGEKAEAFNLDDFIRGCMTEQKALLREDLWLKARARRDIAISLTAAPEEGNGTGAHGAAVAFADISHRREIDELRDSIISMVSHELRTPIHHVRGYASSLLQADVQWDEGTRQDFIRSIDSEAGRLGKLVSNILEMSRIGSGGASALKLVPTDTKEMVKEGVEEASFQLQRHDILVNTPESLPRAMADSERIKLVLTNLLDNAAKYSPAGSRIRVSARTGQNEVIFSVEDEGPGIPAEERERIFERFTRLYQSGASQIPGTGLGLAICRMIVSSHNGRIWVDSGPGGGSTFCFTLPVA